jgi:hypothetical protein
MKLQKVGGYAAFAFLFVLFISNVFQALLTKHLDLGNNDPVKVMKCYLATPAGFYVASSLDIVWAILLLVYYFALYERMQANAPNLTRIMLIAASVGTAMLITFEIVWMTALRTIAPTPDVSAYKAMDAVASGLQMMGQHALGWAFLFVGCAVLKTGAFSKVAGWLYLLAGILHIPDTFLGFSIRGGGLILSTIGTIWIGIALIRQKQPQSALKN